MFDQVRKLLLRLLRVPSEPEPPAGAPGTLRVFRAARNYYRFRLWRWALTQLGAILGLVVSVVMIDRFAASVVEGRPPAPPANVAPTAPGGEPAAGPEAPGKAPKRTRADRSRSAMRQVTNRLPDWLFPLLRLFEYGAIVLFLLQLPFTYALARLDYEFRWYMVTDRSLRIRSGLTQIQETTMSFANLQQVVVSQGPLQRLLGIADVRVQSAGGGEGSSEEADSSLHTGVFHGVENAREIRDLILDRLRLFRESGLGDPDEPSASPSAGAPGTAPALAAARTLLSEARALRRTLG
jgi:membrane protein YdbS with pleckstrin-like domain